MQAAAVRGVVLLLAPPARSRPAPSEPEPVTPVTPSGRSSSSASSAAAVRAAPTSAPTSDAAVRRWRTTPPSRRCAAYLRRLRAGGQQRRRPRHPRGPGQRHPRAGRAGARATSRTRSGCSTPARCRSPPCRCSPTPAPARTSSAAWCCAATPRTPPPASRATPARWSPAVAVVENREGIVAGRRGLHREPAGDRRLLGGAVRGGDMVSRLRSGRAVVGRHRAGGGAARPRRPPPPPPATATGSRPTRPQQAGVNAPVHPAGAHLQPVRRQRLVRHDLPRRAPARSASYAEILAGDPVPDCWHEPVPEDFRPPRYTPRTTWTRTAGRSPASWWLRTCLIRGLTPDRGRTGRWSSPRSRSTSWRPRAADPADREPGRSCSPGSATPGRSRSRSPRSRRRPPRGWGRTSRSRSRRRTAPATRSRSPGPGIGTVVDARPDDRAGRRTRPARGPSPGSRARAAASASSVGETRATTPDACWWRWDRSSAHRSRGPSTRCRSRPAGWSSTRPAPAGSTLGAFTRDQQIDQPVTEVQTIVVP